MKYPLPALLALLTMLVASCASGANIPPDLSPAELIQRAQESSDRNRFGQALAFYEAVLERFPSDLDSVVAAEYEIAFILYRQRNFDEARARFEALLSRYDAPGGDALPEKFRVLAEIVLGRIDAAESRRGRRR